MIQNPSFWKNKDIGRSRATIWKIHIKTTTAYKSCNSHNIFSMSHYSYNYYIFIMYFLSFALFVKTRRITIRVWTKIKILKKIVHDESSLLIIKALCRKQPSIMIVYIYFMHLNIKWKGRKIWRLEFLLSLWIENILYGFFWLQATMWGKVTHYKIVWYCVNLKVLPKL